jgi:lipopolysaccharide exporter
MTTGDSATDEGRSADPPATSQTVVRSAATAVVIAWSLRLIGLVSVLVLARMLSPRDFGIVALATSVVALVDIFSALGLRQALLRIGKPERAHYDTAWTIQLIVLTGLAFVLLAIAPVAAGLYGEPALTSIIAILAICFVIDGLGNIGTVDFERYMNFRRDLKMRLHVRLLSFAVTISMALILQNYWALVIGLVAQSVLNAVASYVFHPYRPKFSLAKRREMLGVSLWMFLASASQTIHSQVEKLVVGRIAARSVLGLYSVSRDLSSIFTEEIATAFNRVTFVTTARRGGRLSSDAGRLSSLLGAYGLVVAPLGLGLSATAEDALSILLGPQWKGATAFLAIIAPSGALYAVHKLIISTMQASGDVRYAALLSIGGSMLMVSCAAALAIAGYDAKAIAVAALIVTAFLLAGGIGALARRAKVRFAAVAMAVIRPFAAAALMWFAVRSLDTSEWGDLAGLAVKAPVGAVVFAIAATGLWLVQGRPEGAEKLIAQFIGEKLAKLRSTRLSSV